MWALGCSPILNELLRSFSLTRQAKAFVGQEHDQDGLRGPVINITLMFHSTLTHFTKHDDAFL